MQPINAFPNFFPAISQDQPQFGFRDLSLTSARSNEELTVAGSFLYVPTDAFDSDTVVSSTLSAGTIFVRPNFPAATPIVVTPGQLYFLGTFSKLYITSAAQASKMVRIYFSAGPITIPFTSTTRITGTVAVSGTVDTAQVADGTAWTAGGGTANTTGTLISAADTAMRSRAIQNTGSAVLGIADTAAKAACSTLALQIAAGATFFDSDYNGDIYGAGVGASTTFTFRKVS